MKAETNDQDNNQDLICLFWRRLDGSVLMQYRPQETEVLQDPITGHISMLARGRQHRHVETKKEGK